MSLFTEMKFLLDNRFAPTTLGFGFLQAGWTGTTKSFESWLSEIGILLEKKSLSAPLPTLLSQLEPLRPSKDKDLLVKTKGEWIAYFGNGILGSDADPVISYLAKRLRCLGVTFNCIPDRRKARLVHRARETYGSVCFQMFGPEEENGNNSIRLICAARDGARWIFESRGLLQPFEEPRYYENKKVADRFPPELLERYLLALGIAAFEQQFYKPMGFLLTRDTRDYRNPKVLKPHSYSELQSEMRWDIPD